MTFINIWLLFNLLFPFTIVLLHSWIQYQRARMTKVVLSSWKISQVGKIFQAGDLCQGGQPCQGEEGGRNPMAGRPHHGHCWGLCHKGECSQNLKSTCTTRWWYQCWVFSSWLATGPMASSFLGRIRPSGGSQIQGVFVICSFCPN